MKFGILTINYKRPQVFKLFCTSIKRLREETGIDFPAVCVSEIEDVETCKRYTPIDHIIFPNTPVSEKWNEGCEYLGKIYNPDYIIILGSDDIMSTQCLRNIMSEMQNDTDLIGFNKIYVYDADGKTRGTLKLATSRAMMGVGKTIHRRVLDAVDWRPWECSMPRNFGMDAVCARNISLHVKTRSFIEGVIVDVKTKESLNKFSMFTNNRHGVDADKSIFYNILSKEERYILDSIRYTGLGIEFPLVHKRGRTLI